MEGWYIGIIPFLLLIPFLVNYFIFKSNSHKAKCMTIFLLASAVLLTIFQYSRGAKTEININYWDWINIEGLKVYFALRFDELAVFFVLFSIGVAIVSLLVINTKQEKKADSSFYNYLPLLVFFMTMFYLAENLVVLFWSWQGFCFCNYVMCKPKIWEPGANFKRGNKLLFLNLVFDFFIFIGIAGMAITFKNNSFTEIFQIIGAGENTSNYCFYAIAIVVGILGKANSLPALFWGHDISKGHRGHLFFMNSSAGYGMGIFAIMRMAPLFVEYQTIRNIIVWIPAISAFLFSWMLFYEKDLRKIATFLINIEISFSFVAAGTGLFGTSVYHMFTMLLINQIFMITIFRIGADFKTFNYKKIFAKKGVCWTFWTMVFVLLSISPIPGFPCFFSVNEVLWSTMALGREGVFCFVLLTLTRVIVVLSVMNIILQMFFHSRTTSGEATIVERVTYRTYLTTMAFIVFTAGYLGMPKSMAGEWAGIFQKFINKHIAINDINTFDLKFWQILIIGFAFIAILVTQYIFLYGKRNKRFIEVLNCKTRLLSHVSNMEFGQAGIAKNVIFIPIRFLSFMLDKYINEGIGRFFKKNTVRMASWFAMFGNLKGMTLSSMILLILTSGTIIILGNVILILWKTF